MTTLKYIDAFSGLGGFGICASRVAKEINIGSECVASIEFDKNCRLTYEMNFGHPQTHNDITTVDPGSFPIHNLLMGGFPCQPFSRNGKFYNKNDKTLGDDDRKNLVNYLLGILEVKQPEFFLFENVKELTTIKNTDGTSCFNTILSNIREIGYEVDWKVLDAKDYGLPQQRKRIYIVGRRGTGNDMFIWPEKIHKSPTPCVLDILEKDVADRYLVESVWRKRKNMKKPGYKWESMVELYNSGKWKNPSSPTGKIEPLAILYGDTPSGGPRQQDKLYSVMGISPTIATIPLSIPAFDTPQGWRQLTPRECARLQGYPDSYILPEKDSIAYKQVGNSIALNVVMKIISNILLPEKIEGVMHGFC